MTYFRMVKSTLSSALSSFTSEFGMGSGGSYSLLSPGKSALGLSSPISHLSADELPSEEIVRACREIKESRIWYVHLGHVQTLERYMVKPHGQLVLVSFTHYCASTPSLSTL